MSSIQDQSPLLPSIPGEGASSTPAGDLGSSTSALRKKEMSSSSQTGSIPSRSTEKARGGQETQNVSEMVSKTTQAVGFVNFMYGKVEKPKNPHFKGAALSTKKNLKDSFNEVPRKA